MLKKKNIAMVMAATTVATSVAPVFAAGVERTQLEEEALIARVEELLNTKYSDAKEDGDGLINTEATGVNTYTNSVYKIQSNINKQGATLAAGSFVDVTSVADLKDYIEAAKTNRIQLTLTVTDKGHKEEDGKIVAVEEDKYSYYPNVQVGAGQTIDSNKLNRISAKAVNNGNNEATIQLANGTDIELVKGDHVLDLDKPVDENGNVISTATNLDRDTALKVVGFKKLEGTTTGVQDIADRIVSELSFNTSITELEVELSELMSGNMYTNDGADFVNDLIKTHTGATFVKNGVEYQVKLDAPTTNITSVTSTKDGYKFEINLKFANTSRPLPAANNLKITVVGDSQSKLNTIANDIKTKSIVTAYGSVRNLEGENRFETAVSISKESFQNEGVTATATKLQANAVVLVGENAIVDGLAAAPLARQEQAPILLAKKDSIPSETMNEIKRILPRDGKVYIVGGENTISEEVEAQLIDEMNAQIVRLNGEDRYETSLKIAEQMTKNAGARYTMTDLFVVGGEGEADAMSIAAIAANKTTGSAVAPIIVTPEAGLTKDQKIFLKDNKALAVAGAQHSGNITNVGVIGGTSKISTKVITDIKSNLESTDVVERVAGDDRKETNYKVINKYAGNLKQAYLNNNPTNQEATKNDIFVAQDGYVGGNGKLIDALAAAPLAGRNGAPIVLATEDLTVDQERVIDQKTDAHDIYNSTAANRRFNRLTKIGGGVSETTIAKLLKVLGLN